MSPYEKKNVNSLKMIDRKKMTKSLIGVKLGTVRIFTGNTKTSDAKQTLIENVNFDKNLILLK